MFRQSHRTLLSTLVAFALLLGASAPALAAQKDDKKDDKKAAKDDKPKPTKQERKYQEIRQFSEKRYREKPEFKDEVDEAFRQKQREHSEYAFTINTQDAQDDQRTQVGDRLKVRDALYDNPLAQDYVNRVGQSVVPPGSTRLYAFKITLNPVPEARSLSTGTVYISSGLLSQIDNEAQLAYVLGHEVAHVEREHWFQDVMVQHGLDDYNEKQQEKRAFIGAVTSVALGAATGGLGNSLIGGVGTAFLAEALIMPNILKVAVPNAVVSWDKLQEDEADQLGLEYMMRRNYDPREAERFYDNLKVATAGDRRAGLGFMANAARVAERVQYISNMVGGFSGSLQDKVLVGSVNLGVQQLSAQAAAAAAPAPQPQGPDTGKSLDPTRDAGRRAQAMRDAVNTRLSPELKQKLDAGELIGNTSEFLTVMAELKRDNGVRALYYDMFRMARTNLEESLHIRSNDPLSHFYYGKVMKLTARTPAEKQLALNSFVKAIQLDRRQVLPEARLHRALALIENKDTQLMPEIVSNLKEYVTLYQRTNGGQLPPNMDVIYDYMQEAGELTWSAPPVMNISTKNIDPIGVASGAAVRPAAAAAPAEPSSQTTSAPAPAAATPARPARGSNRRP